MIDDAHDLWLVYELGSKTLSQRLCIIKGENLPSGDRVYTIHHQSFYKSLSTNSSILAQFITKAADALASLQSHCFVHSDIKPDNLLVKFDAGHTKIEQLKLIDFGSSFKFEDNMQISAATPEYLPPEILIYLEKSFQKGDK